MVAVPAYNEGDGLARTLDSILAQTERDLRVVVMDNCSTDATAKVARAYAGADPRVTYTRGDSHVGIVDNWRRAFLIARTLHPSAPYFAWAGGHDVVYPRWLEVLAAELDAHPSLVGVFPTGLGTRSTEEADSDLRSPVDTFGLESARDRIKVPLRGMAVQGLFRPDALQRAGIVRHVIAPDRLLVAELAAHGQIRHVPERLWERRMGPKMTKRETKARQRAAIFPQGGGLLARVPWLVGHGGALAWNLGVRGRARPRVGRVEGLALAGAYVRLALARRMRVVTTRERRRAVRLRKASRRAVRARSRTGAAPPRSGGQAGGQASSSRPQADRQEGAARRGARESLPLRTYLVGAAAIRPPRAVVAVPAYNEEAHLAETLDSLLSQSEPNIRVVVLDNRSSDATPRIGEAYAWRDERVTYERADSHVGLVDNWRRSFRRARELHPEARYFAWASGHDRLYPRWVEVLADALDADSALVGAFATGLGVKPDGGLPSSLAPPHDTSGIATARERIRVPLPGMLIQGLWRPEAVERAGIKRRVLLPDRLLVAELAAHGEIRHVNEALWVRHMNPPMSTRQSRARQRATIFPEGVPLYARLPWLTSHVAALLWSLAVRRSAPGLNRAGGATVALGYVATDARRRVRVTRRRVRWALLRRANRVARRALRRRKRLRRRLRAVHRRSTKALRRTRKLVRRSGRRALAFARCR